jgi:hypothetical protein
MLRLCSAQVTGTPSGTAKRSKLTRVSCVIRRWKCAKTKEKEIGNSMKKTYVALFCIFVCFSSSFSQSSNIDKYNVNKKSAVGAAALQFFLPGTGNAYANQGIVKIITYPTVFVACLGAGAIGSTTTESTHEKNVWLVCGIVGAGLNQIIGIIDASFGCSKYNEELRKKYDLVFKDNGIQIECNF